VKESDVLVVGTKKVLVKEVGKDKKYLIQGLSEKRLKDNLTKTK
jgi:hypothetical protein